MSRDSIVSPRFLCDMAALRVFVAVLALGARAFTSPVSVKADDVTLSLEPQLTGGFELVLTNGENRTVYGHIGRTLVGTHTTIEIEGGTEVHIGGATLQLLAVYDEASQARGIKIKWDTEASTRLEDCIDFGSKHWYGGPMQQDQIYPIEKAHRQYSAYITTEEDNGAIVERYWLNSAGEYIYVHPQVPLFVDYHNLHANHICFGAQIASPYSSKRNHTELSYDIWFLDNVKVAHKHAVSNYLGQPSDLPDYRMVQHPIWSTWAQFSADINDTILLDHAETIIDHGFNNSQFEIDDLWEVCYGSLTVDEKRFPDLKGFVGSLKELGYRATLWVHPFINKGCDPWYSEALNNSYFVMAEDGDTEGLWWNSNSTVSGYIDFTNPAAAEWWYQRVKTLSDTYGIDSFKFDAGETNYFPQVPNMGGDVDLQPQRIVDAYVRTCARFGDMIEVRVGHRTQTLPIFVRMVDRDSIWGLMNGLSTVITTTFQMNLNGYTLVLPDMIGGNGFNLNHPQAALPSKELFIRWVQVNTFLPVMQFSFAPWNFDNETVQISKKYADLHAAHAEDIYAAMRASVEQGTPVNPPLWWADPSDPEALVIWDEYLLGETILVAPVVEEGATSRDIYIPAGTWLAEGDPDRVVEGPTWLRSYAAPIEVLPYFVRESAPGPDEPDAANAPNVAVFLVLLGLIANVFHRF